MEQYDPSQMRVSDEDRHKVAEVLREAAAQGRIDLEELDERLGAACRSPPTPRRPRCCPA